MASTIGLERIIGAALLDRSVCTALLENPLSLADRFSLSIPERRFIVNAKARSLEQFASMVARQTVSVFTPSLAFEPVRLAG
jgi:hypothetical protein